MKEKEGFKKIQEDVCLKGYCISCGACFISCPFSTIEYNEKGPILKEGCNSCGICLNICPRYKVSIEDLENYIFGRTKTREDNFGINDLIFIGKSKDKEILKYCQDGGAVTSMLTFLLGHDADSCIISGTDDKRPLYPFPIATNEIHEIIKNAGTRYTYSPNILALKKAIEKGYEKIVFVGTPCQIITIRRIQRANLKFGKKVIFCIGLFCSESFNYESLSKKVNELGFNLKDIVKMNIKGKIIFKLKNDKIIEVPLKEIKDFSNNFCHYCSDFSAELADVSVGGIGLDGLNMIITRTEKGSKILKDIINQGLLEMKPMNEYKKAYNLLIQLSKIKKEKFEKIK